MRASKRTAILDTIVEIIETDGSSEVIYENVATQRGISKLGLIYHFSSREDMIRNVHEHMVQLWEEELIEVAGGPAEEVSPASRLRANLQVLLDIATRAELLMSINSTTNPELREIWTRLLRRRNPPVEQIATNEDVCMAYIIQIISDGLWASDYLNGNQLTKTQRMAIAETATKLIPESME